MSDSWKGIVEEARHWLDPDQEQRNSSGAHPYEKDLIALLRRAVAHGFYVGLYEETQGEQPLGTALRYGQAIEDGQVDPMTIHIFDDEGQVVDD